MKNVLVIAFFILFWTGIQAQNYDDDSIGKAYNLSTSNLTIEDYRDSIRNSSEKVIKVKLSAKTHYTDYKIISHNNDTTFIDTTLSIRKEYLFNFVRKDNFELMAFHNPGQTFNRLGYDFNSSQYIPEIGMQAKHFNYKEVEDITYYNVPTPTSELMFRSTLEQGQLMDAFITMNTSPNFNFSFAYKGLRSLGKYRRALSNTRNFRTTFNYFSENNRYSARGHFVGHNYMNEENGGLTELSDEYFRSGDSNYSDRARLDVNFTDAENTLESKRYYLEHEFKLLREVDTTKTNLSDFTIGHNYTYESKHYRFSMTQNDLIGDAFQSEIDDNTGLKTMNNQVYLELNSPIVLGTLRAKGSYYVFDHYFNGITYLNDQIIDQNMDGNTISAGADWNAKIKNFNLTADVSTIFSGDLEGNSLNAAATYNKDSIFTLRAAISTVSKSPNFNFLHFQSDYINYNWQNESLKNEQIRNLSFEFISDKWVNASASLSQVDNYTYFDINSTPTQASEAVNYLKVKINKPISFGKFTLDNTLLYQNVSKGEAFFRVPDFVTRNAFYYTNYLFKNKPLLLQTGFMFRYFTSYFMNDYNPLLSEFIIQNDEEFGGYPVVDFFANAQVRRTRIYFKLENITSSFTGRDYYSAPLNPYRDFTVRFGLVWNFFI